MAFDQGLAERVRNILAGREMDEKQMFGGVGFLLDGNMACGVYQEFLIVRVGPEFHDSALVMEYVRQFDITVNCVFQRDR